MTRAEYWDRVLAVKRQVAMRSPEDEEREEIERRLRLARVPRGYWDVDLDVVPDQFEYKRQVQSWMRKFVDHLRRGEPFPGLYLHGPLGSGKTALAAAIMRSLFGQRVPGVWLNYNEIVDVAASDPANIDGTNEGLWTYANHARVLVIDDVGRGGADNTFASLQLRRVEELLRNRWNQGLPTIVTSNGSLDGLREIHADSLASVLDEASYTLEVKGANFRGWKAKHKEPL